MELIPHSTQKILIAILKHAAQAPTITMLEEILKMSHVGIWKSLKKLETANMIVLKTTGNKKNSVYTAYLNWDNPLVAKTLALALEHEATPQRRWQTNFAELENKVDFLILHGSILVSPQKANDIDIISIVSKKHISGQIESIIMKIQKTQLKPIHNIIIAPTGLKDELKKPNIAFVNAIKEGIILFGQDKFVTFIQELKQ